MPTEETRLVPSYQAPACIIAAAHLTFGLLLCQLAGWLLCTLSDSAAKPHKTDQLAVNVGTHTHLLAANPINADRYSFQLYRANTCVCV
jgi:hypothetical protein